MVSVSAFALAVLLSGSDNVVLVEFSADWCGACRAMEPTLRRLETDGYSLQRINVDRDPQAASRFGITSVPSFVLLVGGREVERVTGGTSYARLAQMFERAGGAAQGSAPQVSAAPTSNQPMQLVRGQSQDRRGLGIPRPLAAIARGIGGRSRSNSDAETSGLDPQVEMPRDTTGPLSDYGQQAGPTRPSAAPPRPGLQLPVAVSPQLTEQALRATVRIRVEDATGHSVGTGTIIDTHGSEALVVTCGHIFRDSQGNGRIAVDLFDQGNARTVAGTVISYDLERDIGLIAISPGSAVDPVRVAPPGFRLTPGQSVFSIGCDKGAAPSIRESQITTIDRYVGAPNIEVAGAPVDGRSGGGLFAKDGFLIGICNAADPTDQEGIFASLPIIHWELDKIGQRQVYDPQAQQLAQTSPAAPDRPLVNRDASAEARTPAVPAPISDTPTVGHDTEVICIVRSRNNPTGSERLLILDRPSRELLDRLASESQNTPQVATRGSVENSSPGLPARRDQAIDSPLSTSPVVRAQSENR